jgi:hypothetical protein
MSHARINFGTLRDFFLISWRKSRRRNGVRIMDVLGEKTCSDSLADTRRRRHPARLRGRCTGWLKTFWASAAMQTRSETIVPFTAVSETVRTFPCYRRLPIRGTQRTSTIFLRRKSISISPRGRFEGRSSISSGTTRVCRVMRSIPNSESGQPEPTSVIAFDNGWLGMLTINPPPTVGWLCDACRPPSGQQYRSLHQRNKRSAPHRLGFYMEIRACSVWV